MSMKTFNMKRKLSLIIPMLIVIALLCRFGSRYWFLRINLSDGYYVQQKPFTSNYILKSKTKGKIFEWIYEWKEVDSYIYGSRDMLEEKESYYLLNKATGELELYDTLDLFDERLDTLKLVYTMDNCMRVMDYKLDTGRIPPNRSYYDLIRW